MPGTYWVLNSHRWLNEQKELFWQLCICFSSFQCGKWELRISVLLMRWGQRIGRQRQYTFDEHGYVKPSSSLLFSLLWIDRKYFLGYRVPILLIGVTLLIYAPTLNPKFFKYKKHMIEENKIWWDSGILIRERARVISLVMVNGIASIVKESFTHRSVLRTFHEGTNVKH